MLNPISVALACASWLAIMFGLARWAQRNPPVFARYWWWIYGLSLAIHCTSWTFYGTVSQAFRSGWWVPPTFVGAILMYTLGFGFLRRLVRLGRESHATSIADLIASRLGKNAPLAAAITLVMIVGMIPYIALQLRAVTSSFSMLMRGGPNAASPVWYTDIALYCALAMAVFAVLFGARDANASAHNRGLVLAIAFESVFKLLAMLAVGAFVVLGSVDLPATTATIGEPDTVGFMPLIALGAMAMFIQPHQFHMAVVENRTDADTGKSRWMLPLYLLLIALPVLPMALIGKTVFQDSMSPDLYVLALPMHAGNGTVALIAFLGGLSAATGMVVVSVLTLSLMVINHWLSPALLRGAWAQPDDRDLRQNVVLYRRAAILVIMMLAWAFGRSVDNNAVLADVGAFSFSAMVPALPALLFALWRPQNVPPQAVTIGVLVGLATWVWVMLLPRVDWMPQFPLLIRWLEPQHWLGLDSWSTLGKGVTSSLIISYLVTLALASRFSARQQRRGTGGLQVATLRSVASRFLAPQRVAELFQGEPGGATVSPGLGAQVESELSKVLGSSSAHLLLDAAHNRQGLAVDQVARIVDESRVGLQFNQQILEAALKNMSQGISVVDRDLNLVAWNPRYAELFGFPQELLKVGTPVAQLTRYAMRQTHPDLPVAQLNAAVERRLAYMRAGTTHLTERVLPNGDIVEIRGNPMPGGGFVATYTDVTQFRQTQLALTESNATLESRVLERTQLLQIAKKEAEFANEAKTRFMTAVGHDLMQPLHAAHLFADGLEAHLQRKLAGNSEPLHRLQDIRGALERTSDLLQSLMDMAKLKSGGLTPAMRVMPSRDITDPLASEFTAIARAKGLRFVYQPCEEWIHTDAMLLRRILQNFLSNAVRYAAQGEITLRCESFDGQVQLAVIDQGPGLDLEARQWIFEEFRRGSNTGDSGLGLGLSIARGLSDLLHVELGIESAPGQGSTFFVTLPAAAHATVMTVAPSPAQRDILLVDNESPIRNELAQLISGWSHNVHAHDGNDVQAIAVDAASSQVWLFDYHLDNGQTGVDLYLALTQRLPARPTLILTADISDAVRAQCAQHDLILVSKPIRPLALKSVLQRLISASAQSRTGVSPT